MASRLDFFLAEKEIGLGNQMPKATQCNCTGAGYH